MILFFVQPVRHRRELLGDAAAVRAITIHRVVATHGGHEIAHDPIEERGVPIRGGCCRCAGREGEREREQEESMREGRRKRVREGEGGG